MSYVRLSNGGVDYAPCRYPGSDLVFRGPVRDLSGAYAAMLGDGEIFGRFMEAPLPDLLEQCTGTAVLNLGVSNAGIEAFLNDEGILSLCRRAKKVVVQVTGAHWVSNPFYMVHRRRNDRFIRPTALMRKVFPNLDFTEIHFTGHLLQEMARVSESRFALVRDELRRAWVNKMLAFIESIGKPIILLWLSDHAPEKQGGSSDLATSPLLVDRAMLDTVVAAGARLVEVVATEEEISAGYERMLFGPAEGPAARQFLGPVAHQEAARRLMPFMVGK